MSGAVGGMLGKYRLVAEIARGGMGIVYLALLRGPGGFNKLVVVKELKPELVQDPAFLRMFLDEARLAARLNHPNIVQTNEVGSDGDRYFMAMDYLDGRAFDRVRRRSYHAGAILPLPLQLRVIADALSGLDYAHHLTDFDGTPLALVHRDVSPSNLFITFDGQIKLLDFGIAKTRDSSLETRVGVLKGKLSYMPPEQARGERVDATADTFAIGVMLWEALTSRRLRNTQNDYALLRSLALPEMPRAATVNPLVPPMLDAVCARALAVNPAERYATAAELRQDLEQAIVATGLVATNRELGAVVASMFADERSATSSLIEAHVARARTSSEEIDLPIIHGAAGSSALGSTPSGEAQWPAWDVASSPLPMPPTVPGQGLVIGSTESIAQPARRSRPVIAAVTVASLAVAALVYVAFFLPPRAVVVGPPIPEVAAMPALTSVSAPAQAAVAQPEPQPAPSDSLVEVEIRVTPHEAAIMIDGALVAGNPFRGKFARGEVMHQIRAEAPGYVAKVHAVAFSAHVKMDLALERRTRTIQRTVARAQPLPPKPVDPPVAQPASPPAPAPAAINPAGGTKPRRPIDSTNPYGTDP